jgi:hypothetical protein
MNSTILRDITPCGPIRVSSRFGRRCRFHIQGRRIRNHYEASSKLLLGLFFDPDDGGDMFLRNIRRLSMNYLALYPRDKTLRKDLKERIIKCKFPHSCRSFFSLYSTCIHHLSRSPSVCMANCLKLARRCMIMDRMVNLCKWSLQRWSHESKFVLYVRCLAVGKVINATRQADDIKYFTALDCKPDTVQLHSIDVDCHIYRWIAEFPGTLLQIPQTWICLLETLIAVLLPPLWLLLKILQYPGLLLSNCGIGRYGRYSLKDISCNFTYIFMGDKFIWRY